MTQLGRTFAAACALAMVSCGSSAQAAFFSFPRMLKLQLERIGFETPTLAPVAFSRFCMEYAVDCQVRGDSGTEPVVLTDAKWRDLVKVDRDVNRAIAPKVDEGGVVSERWQVSPKAGACHDYAVTKRHELLARGWPSSALLLAEVVVPWGEHHLVLVVRTDRGDLVLDNLTAGIRSWAYTSYRWVRIESPQNPKFWSTIAPTFEQNSTAPAVATMPSHEVMALLSGPAASSINPRASSSGPTASSSKPAGSSSSPASLGSPAAALSKGQPENAAHDNQKRPIEEAGSAEGQYEKCANSARACSGIERIPTPV